jgi:hypothetical protein
MGWVCRDGRGFPFGEASEICWRLGRLRIAGQRYDPGERVRSAGKVRAAWLMAVGLMAVLAWAVGAVRGQAAPGPAASGQSAKPAPDAKKGEKSLGGYSLITTVFEPSAATHLLMPRPTIAVDGGTAREPGEFSGDKTVPAQYAIEGFGSPWYECAATAPKLLGCEALDRATLTVRDANTIGYHIVSHGAAVELSVNVEVHDILPVSTGSAEIPWHARDVIFVAVAKATPAYRFSSEVLVGEWNGEAVVFEVGKDLPEGAKKALEDLGVKQDLGDRVLYSFRVKAPEKKP